MLYCIYFQLSINYKIDLVAQAVFFFTSFPETQNFLIFQFGWKSLFSSFFFRDYITFSFMLFDIMNNEINWFFFVQLLNLYLETWNTLNGVQLTLAFGNPLGLSFTLSAMTNLWFNRRPSIFFPLFFLSLFLVWKTDFNFSYEQRSTA